MQNKLSPRSKIIGLIGHSGSGKTTLIEKILPLLKLIGLRVNVIKSSHHDIVLEPPHKDSARIRTAGAEEVLLASPYRFMIAHELDGTQIPPLEQMLERMKPADLTLVEGYKQARIQRIEIFRPSLHTQPLYLTDQTIKAVASDTVKPNNLPEGVLWLNLNNESEIVDWILGRI